jgi:hypothetical protein
MPGLTTVRIDTATQKDAEALEDFLRGLLPPFMNTYGAVSWNFDSEYVGEQSVETDLLEDR